MLLDKHLCMLKVVVKITHILQDALSKLPRKCVDKLNAKDRKQAQRLWDHIDVDSKLKAYRLLPFLINEQIDQKWEDQVES